MQMNKKQLRAAINAARRVHESEGQIEVDDTPLEIDEMREMVSEPDDGFEENGGVYVRAWVWVTAGDIDREGA